jgi:hypothetical protein
VTRTNPLYQLRTTTRDASASVTVIDMGFTAIDLKGLKLNDSTLLIRPTGFDWLPVGSHWGVDLTNTDPSTGDGQLVPPQPERLRRARIGGGLLIGLDPIL